MDSLLAQIGMGGLSSLARGNTGQDLTPWPGLALALLVSIALVVCFFLVQNLARAWIRSRIGFHDQGSKTSVHQEIEDQG